MIDPPFAFITGVTAKRPRYAPRTLTAKMRSRVDTLDSSRGSNTRIPALLTSTSTVPNLSAAALRAVAQSASDVTSCFTNRASLPSSAAVCRPSSALKSVRTTFAPSSTKTRAASAPCPPAAPVTIATFPASIPDKKLLLASCRLSRLFV